ncbi:MAG: hypothetical protein A3F70_19300 [Acidobacteria bacterium RIFCSPLOWO2_12_FULL_67_14]|nr:MAG: hypothetical protein A3H29_05215 [Acidobacteria bacterium RIFCSPLOWO2_02_FULL_67_21]OFW36065.1 MAG: hypothetical protein A3F70_19300 [Acidobacteria bacterium RIFCSPLOWO2_12_FULL_67_14]
MSSVIIIGGGHNGLTAAFYLGRAGFKPIVLERRDSVGGGAITGELHPGFKCPTLSHHAAIWSGIAADMRLEQRGVSYLRPPVEVYAASADGAPAVVYADNVRAGDGLRSASVKDAEAYPRYRAALTGICGVLASILTSPPPDIDRPDARDLWNLLVSGRRFRGLGGRDAYRLLRWLPMPVADLAGEWFESDLLRAALCGPGVSGTMLGPRSAGSALVLLLRETHRLLAGSASRVRGGPGALTGAMAAAAREAGADIRTGTRVEQILVEHDRVSGVIAGGGRIPASAVISAVDPKTTVLDLIDPVHLSPDFLSSMRNYRAAGTVAKVNLALSALPAFGGSGPAKAGHYGRVDASTAELLSGRIHIGPGIDYLERAFDRAKYGELSEDPWLDIAIPSILDPGLAPPGAHVMSVCAHYAPFALRGAGWPALEPVLLERVLRTLERFAPGIRRLVVAAQAITPAALAADYGFHGGHIFHGELALDQLLMMRPVLGFGRYQTPLPGLHLCSAGTHPGGLMSGASGKMAAAHVTRALKGQR